MNRLNSFKNNDLAAMQLAIKIFDNSVLCAESLKQDLGEKFKKDSKEYHQKYTEVLFEFLYFHLQLTDRIGFNDLGHEKRQKLNDVIGPLVVDSMIKTLFGHWPSHLQDGIKKDFYENLNNAQIEYSECKSLMLKEEDDISYADKVATGAKSKGTVNLLADNLMDIFNTYNPITRLRFMHLIIVNLKIIDEFKHLILKASAEI